MAVKREDKYALAKARRERAVSKAQERQLELMKRADERMAFNQKMGNNVASASNLTSDQQGRLYEATGLDNASNPQEAIKGEIVNTGLSFVQIANALANKAGANDAVARGAGQVLGRMIPYGTGTMDTDKAIDTYSKWGTGNVTKGDVANVALTGAGIKVASTAIKGAVPIARGIKTAGISLPVPVGVGGVPIVRVGGKAIKPATPVREALPLPPVERFMPRGAKPQQVIPGGFAEQAPDLSGMTDNEKAKVLREFLNPETKKVNVNTGEVGNVVGQDELESQLVTLNIRGRLSSRSRKYGKPYDFNADSRAGAIIASREKGTGALSEADKIRIRQEEVNRNITETRRLLEDAKTNYPDEYAAAMDAGGIPAVLDNFEAAHIQTLTSGGRMDWPNIRFIPKEIHKAQGTKPWAGMGQTLVR
jgi:hypothetical protein